MEGALFSFLDNASPWWWLALGICLLALEMFVASFVLAWPGIAAVFMAVLLWLIPGLEGFWQIVIFAALSVVMAFVGRAVIGKRGQPKSDKPDLNQRTTQMIGREGRIVDGTGSSEMKVEIDGVPWRARLASEGGDVSSEVRVTDVDGLTLIVAPRS